MAGRQIGLDRMEDLHGPAGLGRTYAAAGAVE